MKFAIENEIKDIPNILKKRRDISLKEVSSLLEEPILITGISSSIDLPGWGLQETIDKLGINAKIRYASEISDHSNVFKANTVIAMSFSGETEETADILKNSKAKIKIAITGNSNSTITKYATHVIPMVCGEQISDSASKSVAEEFYIANQLISEKFGTYNPISDLEISRIEKNMNIEFPKEIINKLAGTKKVVVIGSGGLTQETVTKFHEIARTPTEGVLGPLIFYSSIEVLTQGEVILVIEPEKMKLYKDALEKSSRANEIFYINDMGIEYDGYYNLLMKYAGLLKLIIDIGKAKNIDIDHPEILMRTVRGFKQPFFKEIKKITVIGGGGGVPPLIRSFKKLGHNISGITSMVDNGGSAGRLRKDYKVLPAGDIRRLISALSDHPSSNKIVNYRFKGGELDGHTFGNIMLAALEKISTFDDAKSEVEKILGAKGKSLPATVEDCQIHAELDNGQILVGEDEIDIPLRNPFLKIKKVWLEPHGKIFPETEKTILESDIIVIGPGDLYSSLIPNLLVNGMSDAIKKSKAKKFFVCNAMTKLGETIGYDVHEFKGEIEKYLGKNILDFVIFNQKVPSKEMISENQKKEPFQFDFVSFDRKKCAEEENPKIVGADLLTNPQCPIVHDPDILSKIILSLA